MVSTSARIQPDAQPAPHRLAERADRRPCRHRRPTPPRPRTGRTAAGRSMSSSAVVSSMISVAPACRAASANATPLVVRHGGARRVLEVGHQVGGARHRAAEGVLGPFEVPAVAADDGHADEPRAPSPERLGGVRIGRRLDHHPVGPRDEQRRDERDRALRAVRHHDLRRRSSADRATRSVRRSPRAVRGGRRRRSRCARRAMPRSPPPPRTRRRARARPKGSPAAGRCTPSAAEKPPGALPPSGRVTLPDPRMALDVTAVAEAAIRGGHGRAAHAQACGELALGRERRARGDAVVEAEQPDAVGDGLVGRLARAPGSEEGFERARGDAGVHHGATIARLASRHRSNRAIGLTS